MIYATGDTHADFRRFTHNHFPEQDNMSRKDVVLIAGDFGGIWQTAERFPLIDERTYAKYVKAENNELDILAGRNPTFCYVLGNHENWNRYDSDEFPVVDFYGGKAHKIRENVYHLMSGYVFDFDGYKVYAFGGAASHDIYEGILKREDFESDEEFRAAYKYWKKTKTYFRVKDFSWWERESKPTEEEIARGWDNLLKVGNKVDLVLTHCLPSSVASALSGGAYAVDDVTRYLQMVSETVKFNQWICGHYHCDYQIWGKFQILYHHITRIH